jgi:phage shock protein A
MKQDIQEIKGLLKTLGEKNEEVEDKIGGVERNIKVLKNEQTELKDKQTDYEAQYH